MLWNIIGEKMRGKPGSLGDVLSWGQSFSGSPGAVIGLASVLLAEWQLRSSHVLGSVLSDGISINPLFSSLGAARSCTLTSCGKPTEGHFLCVGTRGFGKEVACQVKNWGERGQITLGAIQSYPYVKTHACDDLLQHSYLVSCSLSSLRDVFVKVPTSFSY